MLQPGTSLTGCPGGAAAWAIAQAHNQAWVIVPTPAEAEQLAQELRWWGRRALVFPADESRPYDGLNPHPRVPRQRLQALAALKEKRGALVVASATAILHKVPPLLALTLRTQSCSEKALPCYVFSQTTPQPWTG